MFSSVMMMIWLLVVRTEKVKAFCKGKNSQPIAPEMVVLCSSHQVCIFYKGTPQEEKSLRTDQVILLT